MANNLATIPNIITLARISLIPILVICFCLPYSSSHIFAGLIFMLAAFTDWLDGYLARKLGQVSVFGEFLDPVADKLIVAVSLVFLMSLYPSAWLAIPSAIIVSREIVISALREWMAEIGKRKHLAVSNMGKLKTAIQLCAITLLLIIDPKGPVSLIIAGHLLMYVAAGITLWSMLQYLLLAWEDISSS